MARLLSLITAIVTSLAGHALLFFAASYLQRALGSFAGAAVPVFVAPFAVVGVLLIGVAALTAAWSSVGVLVIGAVQAVVGLLGAVVPVGFGSGTTPRSVVDRALIGLGPLGQTADVWISVGGSLIEGALLLALGWAAARRRRGVVARPGIARVVSVLVTLIALGPATLLAQHGGYRNEQRLLAALAGPDPTGLLLLGIGVILLVALMAATRWSGLGAILWGGLLLVGGLTASILPVVLPRTTTLRGGDPLVVVARGLPPDLASSVLTNIALGGLAVIAVTFLFGGIASALAGRSGRRRATWVQPSTGEVPEVGPRWTTGGSARANGV